MRGHRASARKALQPEAVTEQEILFSALRLHDRLMARWEDFFGHFGLTMAQYNVLRILYVQAPDEGLSCGDIGKRLLSRVPDVTRLLDRLERLELVERHRDGADRRQVHTRLTDRGFDLAEEIFPQALAQHRRDLLHIPAAEQRQLVDLMTRALAGLPWPDGCTERSDKDPQPGP